MKNIFVSLVLSLFLASCFQPTRFNPDQTYSVEMGRTEYGSDHCVIPEVPGGGVLFSLWTKLPADWDHWVHNMDVLVLRGDNWSGRFLVGNVSVDKTLYNANSMIFSRKDGGLWAGDYSYYQSPDSAGLTGRETTGWVWVAWQVVVTGDSMTIRQWLKFGRNGAVFDAGRDTVTFDQLRTFLLNPENNQWFYDNSQGITPEEAAAWVPTDVREAQIGKDYSNVTHARMEARSQEPDLAYLEEISQLDAPDHTAWGDWELNWTGPGPNLQDRSGNGRHLTIPTGGELRMGQSFP